MTISEKGYDTEKMLEFFYKIQRTNNIMQWMPASYCVPVAMTPAQKKTLVRSKLSRIRKKCYLRKDKNATNEYVREVHKYLRIFKPKRREREKWERKIQKTCNDVAVTPLDREEDVAVTPLDRE